MTHAARSRTNRDARPVTKHGLDVAVVRSVTHHAPVALAPLVLRWGANASSNKLRHCARCTVCGHKGATLQHLRAALTAPSAFSHAQGGREYARATHDRGRQFEAHSERSPHFRQGQLRRFRRADPMSALPRKADFDRHPRDVSEVPGADIRSRGHEGCGSPRSCRPSASRNRALRNPQLVRLSTETI